MTRYARARGSAGSNIREPEEATSWAEMRKGMVRKTNKVKDKENDSEAKVVNKRMDNPELEDDMDQYQTEEDLIGKADDSSASEEEMEEKSDDNDDEEEKQNKSIIKEMTKAKSNQEVRVQQQTEVEGEEKKKKKRVRAKDKCLNCKEKGHMKMDCPQLTEERRTELRELVKMKQERKGKGTGRKKNKNKKKNVEQHDNGNKDQVCDGEKTKSQKKNNKNNHKKGQMQKKERKDLAGQIVQQGEGLFQGFRVKKEDAKRLKELQKELESKGVKGDELAAEMKKERRRAEKELARFNKAVCYHCRKPGHMLSECKEAQNQAVSGESTSLPSGQCYKCGSDEHTSRECKSKRKAGDAYAFATCFICKQTGHLAKACPDNPRGLYPKGGGCRFCGSVEHLKSDCPRKKEKDDRTEVRAQRADARDLEVEEAVVAAGPPKRPRMAQPKAKKVVTF